MDHHHSGIRYVSPAEHHDGRDMAILAARHALYLKPRERNPARWSRKTRDWSHIEIVTLNPERVQHGMHDIGRNEHGCNSQRVRGFFAVAAL